MELLLYLIAWLLFGWLVSFVRVKIWRKHVLSVEESSENKLSPNRVLLCLCFPGQIAAFFFNEKSYRYIPIIPNLGLVARGPFPLFNLHESTDERSQIIESFVTGKGYYTRHTVLGVPVREEIDQDAFLLSHYVASIFLGGLHIPFYLISIIWLLIVILLKSYK